MSVSQPLDADIPVPNSDLKSLYTVGGLAAVFQLLAILSYGVITAILGPKPTSAQEYFVIHQTSRKLQT